MAEDVLLNALLEIDPRSNGSISLKNKITSKITMQTVDKQKEGRIKIDYYALITLNSKFL